MFANWIKRGKASAAALVMKLQILILAIAAATALRPVLGEIGFAVLDIALSAYYFFVLLVEVRNAAEGWKYYVVFFSGFWAVLQGVWVVQLMLPLAVQHIALVAALALLLAFLLGFRIVCGRGHTTGRVLVCQGSTAVVETDFDIRTFTRAGKHIVDCGKQCKPGQVVKLGLAYGLLGGVPKRILD